MQIIDTGLLDVDEKVALSSFYLNLKAKYENLLYNVSRYKKVTTH
jgi:hypothetical protein